VSPKKEEFTTIQITKTTRDRLKSLGKKGETYDEIINSILPVAKKKRKSR
jgi:DNA replicative helicase MCM subunit Mcm2 (Cdc46/Mcm family)